MKHDGTDEFTDDERDLIASRKLIDAIRSYRNRTQCSLLSAKHAVDSILENVPLDSVWRPCPHCDGKGGIWIRKYERSNP